MISKYLHIALILGIVPLGFVNLQKATPFQKLTQKLESGKVFHAHFTQHAVDSYTGNETKRSGEIWIAKGGYKIISGKQKIAVNGDISMVYDLKKNRVIISNYVRKDDDFAPSKFLNGIDSTYSIVAQKQTARHYIIKLRSNDPFSVFKKVNIILSNHSIPQKIYVVDRADNKITTTFSSGSFVPRKPGMFVFDYPDDVRVIDMRK